MLTKEERAAIAERLRSTYYITNSTLFKALTGEEELIENDQVKELCVIGRVIFELCDTSNMLELPVDKDGEVIRVDDTVFNTDGERLSVTSIRFSAECGCVVICENDDSINVCSGDELTHKKQATIESLVERFRRVLNKSRMSDWSMAELINIADQLESLGDSDD